MKDVECGICNWKGINVDTGSMNCPGGVPSFVNGSTLKYAGQCAPSGGKDNKGNTCPDEPPISFLHGDTEVKVEDGYLRYCYTDVV